MKTLFYGILFFALLGIVNCQPENDTSLSPYFLVISSGDSTENFPLLSTSANVIIEGVIADVTVTQKYKNDGKKPIEAIYVFPASTRAAVYSMTMKIGERLLVAEIHKKEEAKQIYEKAKNEGKSASLLEQQRPNVFQMNVANIMPGDLITVEMKYTELLMLESGTYEFVYPTVVGPRFSDKKADDAKEDDKFNHSPYHPSGEKSSYDFDIHITLNSSSPLLPYWIFPAENTKIHESAEQPELKNLTLIKYFFHQNINLGFA